MGLVLDTEQSEIETNRAILFNLIADGQLRLIDGVMSPLTVALVEKFDARGVDMTCWWSFTPQAWICPACGRSKSEIARLNVRGQLMCRLVEHHDHVRDLLLKRFREISSARNEVVADSTAEDFAKRSAAMVSSYDNTIVCDDCNVADLNGKKAAKTHADFSFSPAEIRQFAIVKPNAPHEINADVACDLWEKSEETFLLRLKIIERIAEIAANNEHWFQTQSYADHPAHIENTAATVLRTYGAAGELYSLCGPKRTQPTKERSAWRHVPPSSVNTPTKGDIDHVAKVSCQREWDKLSDSWSCPGCRRNRASVIRPTKDHAWKLLVGEQNFWSSGTRWNVEKVVACRDCTDVAQNLGKEAAALSGKTVVSYARWVMIDEVASVVLAKSHSRHSINNEIAEQVVQHIAVRISEDTEGLT